MKASTAADDVEQPHVAISTQRILGGLGRLERRADDAGVEADRQAVAVVGQATRQRHTFRLDSEMGSQLDFGHLCGIAGCSDQGVDG